MPDINLSLKVPAIEKLIDYGASGIGAIAGPMLAPWRASREAKARLASARIDVEMHHIKAESEASTSAIIAKARSEARGYLVTPDAEVRGTLEITREDITQRIEFQERKRIANVKSVLEEAADELDDKEVADHEPDLDWTARFFDCVQDVSSEDMQRIWANILVGEVETPGRTSLRTLSILRNMSQRDAKVFSELMKFRISDYMLAGFAQQVTNEPLDTSLLTIVDIGLVYSSMVAYPSITLSNNGTYDSEHHGYMLRIEGPPGTEINVMDLEATVLTPTGRELANFCRHEPHSEYLSCFARYLETQKCTLKLAPIARMTREGKMRFHETELCIL